MKSFEWHFPSTGNGEEDGLNDPLRENFEGNHEWYVARETIQNSSDATAGGEAVKVHFERLMLPSSAIPGREQLLEALSLAKDYAQGQEGAEEFYDTALEMISAPEIAVLKVSDFNTTGLNGNDQDKQGEWYRLIRATGASSMSGAGGGSFGIGKGAPFAASALRTVLYSTVNEQGHRAFQGKARISSFELDGDVRRGTGLFGIAQGRGVGAVRNAPDIPSAFRRTEIGTDIYIIGYLTEEADWRSKLMQSVVENFWAAIHFGELTISFGEEGTENEEINAANLEEYLVQFSAGSGSSTFQFYKALTEGQRIDDELRLLGDCSLYVKKADGYPKMVQMMRKSKMVIKTTAPGTFRVLGEPFAAVFVCFSEKGNKQLRSLEPPAHNEWDPARDKKFGRQVTRELNDFIRGALRSLAEETESQPEEIPDLNYYLPEEDDLSDGAGSDGRPTDGMPPVESGAESGATRPQKVASFNRPIEKRLAMVKKSGLGGEEGTQRQGEDTATKKKGSADPSTPGKIPYIDTAKINFRARQISKDGNIVYQIVITPLADQSGALKINAVGEDARYPLEIKDAKKADGSSVEFNGSTLTGLELTKDESIRLFLKLATKKKYVIGVGNDGA